MRAVGKDEISAGYDRMYELLSKMDDLELMREWKSALEQSLGGYYDPWARISTVTWVISLKREMRRRRLSS